MLLINPANSEYGGTLAEFTPLPLPMSIGCLAAVMHQSNYPAAIWDEELRMLDDETAEEILLPLLKGMPEPYIFGISVLTAQANEAYRLCHWLKRRFPTCMVIMGGFHVTALPTEPFDSCPVDFVVRGEGERTIIELYEFLTQGKGKLAEIKGISYKIEGKLVQTPERPLIKDLATLPIFPYDLFIEMLDKVNSSSLRKMNYDWGFIVTSRGCPFKCSYCAQRMMTGNTYRWRPIEVIIEELDILINRFGAEAIFFMDDNFCFKRSHTIELCERIRDSKLGEKCHFSLQTRADNFYEDLVPIMRAAGFTSVGFGMEVGTDALMEQIKKGETIQQHIDAVAMAKRHGMDVAMFMIFGIPTETHADRKAAYKLCRSMGLTQLKFNNLMPYPGTPMYQDLRYKYAGRLKKIGHWENFGSALTEMGSPLTQRKPLPYVPETSSEIELTRDVIRYNLMAILFSWSTIKGILMRNHGPGWFKLRAGWYLKPTEIKKMTKLALLLLGNLVFSFCPLFILEPVMHYLNPNLQRRLPKEKWPEHKPTGWATESWKKNMA